MLVAVQVPPDHGPRSVFAFPLFSELALFPGAYHTVDEACSQLFVVSYQYIAAYGRLSHQQTNPLKSTQEKDK
jgi:hypothetical protein